MAQTTLLTSALKLSAVFWKRNPIWQPILVRSRASEPLSGGAPARPSDRTFELQSKKSTAEADWRVEPGTRGAVVPSDRRSVSIGNPRRSVEQLLADERVPMTTAEQNRIIEEVLDEVLDAGTARAAS